MPIVTVAFEGLDGSGKGTAIEELSKIIDCECWKTPDRIKEGRRRMISEQDGETDELQEFMIRSYIEEWSEIERACSGLPPSTT